jgi:hypothetical protein
VPWKTVWTLASAASREAELFGSASASELSWAYVLPPPIFGRCTAMKSSVYTWARAPVVSSCPAYRPKDGIIEGVISVPATGWANVA